MEPDYQGQPITTPDAPPFVPGVTDQRYTPEKEKSTEPMTVPDDPPYIEGITDERFAPKAEENVEGNNYNKLLKDAENNISDVINFDDSVQEEPQLSQIESEKLVAKNKWVKESLGNIDSALLDYENFLPKSTKPVKNRALIRATMEVELGYDPPTISEYEIGRGQAYKQLFGKDLSEDLGDPEQSFVGALIKRATEKKDQGVFDETIRNEALLSALTGSSKYDDSWGEAAKADPVYQKNPAAAANKFKSFKQAFEDQFDDVLPIVKQLNKFIEQNDMDSSLRLIEDLEEEEFSKTAKLLGFIEKQTLATKGEEGLLSNLAKSTGRDFESFSRKFKEGFFDLLSGISAGSTGADFVAEDVLYRDKVNGFLAEIRRFRDQRDPIKLLAEEDTFLSSAEKALYATPGVGFSIAGSILTGPAGTMGLLMESNQEDYYLRAIDAGVSREESNKLAATVGSPIALLQFIPERIGLGAVTRKLPVLDNVVNKITQKHFRVTLQALARSGAETTTEEIQAILSEVGNDVLNGLKSDIPEADWDAHWDNFGSRNLETFLSISPYASLGAFVRDRGVDKSIAMANEASTDELVASGYEKEKVQNFQESEDIGKRKAFFEMLESQDPTRPETKEAVDNLAKLNEMAKKTQAEYSQLRISPGVRMDPKKKGYEVYNTESGDIIATLETAQQATETVFEIFGVKESQRQAAFDELVSKFEAGRLDVDESGEMVEIETRTFTQADALVELPGSDARIETEAKLIEQRNGGTGEVTEEVMSGGQTIFGVYIPAGQMGRKEAATKIFNGSSILTLIHERGHGKRRILMANGKWSRSQQIGSLKALDGMLDEGDRFLPATFEAMSESDQEVALDEAVAELAEVLALRTRNGKKSKMRQLLSKNLSAMVRSRRPGAVQLKAFVDAIKEFFGLALRRAAVMKKAEREGKLSSAQLDALSDMLVGKTSQESFESERDAVPVQMVDGKMVDVPFSVSQSKTGMKPPKGVTSKTTEALPVWNISKQEDSLPKVIGNKKSRETFFARLDSALEWLRKDPAKIGTAGGWVTFLRKAGVYGDVPMPPTGITELFKDPAGYAAKVRGAYHGDLTIEGTNASAKQGLDGTSEMRDLIGKGNAPAPWAVALHHMWGILSRMLPPIDQEGMWLRLIAHRPVLDAIQSSIDGKFNLSLKQWQDLVQDARAASADAAGKIGNNATANANSFYLMLERLSGRWQDVANVYAAKDSREMGRRFWSLDAGALGIKNKVQRFIGLTFGVPGVIMDRWKFVELWLPTAVKGTDSESSKEYFKYSNSKPESPLPIYGVYGDLDAKNIVVSTALYEGLEVAMQEAINRSPELQDLLGDHQNPGGLHWYGWNAIKNEAVGHSSLDLTKDLIKNYGLDFGVDAVVKQINEGEYFTEGTIGSSENAKVFLRNGKIDVSRTRISSGFQSGRGSRVLGRGVSEGDGESRQGVSFSLGRSEVTPTADTQTFPTKDGGVVGPASFSISAFHGTPHKVDKFSTEQIGTGEGAQAYGWGLYFAQDKDVAQQYRIALAYDPDKQRINGRQINDEYSRYNTATATSVDYQILEGLERLMMHDSPAEVIEMFEEEGYSQKAISYFKDSKYETFGGLYSVELNVEQDELLDWDKPLKEQSEFIRKALNPLTTSANLKDSGPTGTYGKHKWTLDGVEVGGFIGGDASVAALKKGKPPEILFDKNEIGASIYSILKGDLKQKSDTLVKFGIKGIRYLDGNSRADGEGTSNYVIFNDADITIIEENGQVVDTTSPSFSLGRAEVTPAQDAKGYGTLLGDVSNATKKWSSLNQAYESAETQSEMQEGVGFELERKGVDLNTEEGSRRLDEAIAAIDYDSTKEGILDQLQYAKDEAESGVQGALERFLEPMGYEVEAVSTGSPSSFYFEIAPDFDTQEWFEENLPDFEIEEAKGKIRFSDHSKTSSLHDAPDVNIQPGESINPQFNNLFNRLPNLTAMQDLSGLSFQIGDTKMLSDLAENAKRRAKRPETRAMVFKDIAERLNKLRRDVPRIIKSFGKEFEQAEIIDPRTMKSLRKEAAFRQALKQEELEQEILQKEGQALQSGDVPVLKDMPVHGFIANVGKGLAGGSMESRSAYRKRTGRKPGAEYEGSEGMVGGLLYGGGRSPDQVAQELFEENLIPDDSPAAMWEALASERESVASQKADFKAAMAKLRGVKSEAKAFADEWLKGEVEKQKRDYNPTERTKRALVMYDAILKALPPKLRGSMGGFVQIGNLKTDEARLKFLEKKLDKADDVVERFIKREMTKEAKKLIKSGLATIKTGEVDRGTKGATVHRLFEVIKDVFSGATTAEAVIAGMEKERQIREDSGQLTAEWDGYYNTAPSIVEGFAEWKEQTAEEMTVAVENAAAFYERGWLQSKIKAALRSEMIEAAIQNLRDGKSDEEIDEAITKSEEAIGSMWDNTKSIGREFIDFEQFLISTFGRIDVVNQLVDREYESYRDREQMRVEREYDESQFYADLFNGDIVKGYRYKYDLKTERVKLDSLGSKGAPGSMTKSQIIHWLMMYRQADGRRHFDGDGKRWEFTPEFFVQLEEKLDDRDMKIMEWYSEQYAGEWEMVNPIYEEIRGSTLVKNEVYSPVTVAPKMISIGGLAGAVMDPLSGELVGAMEATPSMFKRRSKSAVARPRVEGAIEIFQAHKTQVEHWVATAELTRDMKALFGRREAREIVEAKVGKSGLGQLQKWIESFAKEGIKDTSVGMSFWSMIDRSISRVSRYSLFAKMSTIVIQASQVAGAAAQIPARAYMSKLSKAAVGQLDLSSAWRSPYIQGRLADTLPMVRLAYSNSKTKKPTQLSFYSDKIGQAIGFSDAIFTTATYAAIFDHVKNEIKQNQGLTGTALEAAAHKEAGKRTERVAQPVRKARRSLIENWAQGNVALRAVFAFTSEPRQKLGSAFWEMFHAVRKRDRVKNAMVYGIGFAILGSFIRAAMSDVRDEGEDDEFFDEENWNVDKLILKSMTDNFNGVPIAGPVAEDAFISLAKKLGMDTPPSFPNEGLISDPSKAIPAAERLITLESMENSHEFAKDVRKTLQSAAIFSERATTAAVFWNMVEEVIRTMPVVE